MHAQTSEMVLQNPPGYHLDSQLLSDFERSLDPLYPTAGRIPCHVLGYGEISTVLEIQVDGLRELAFKRMSCFNSADEVKTYIQIYLDYNQILEDRVGLHLPPYGFAELTSANGNPVFYIIQKRLSPASIGSNAIQQLAPQEIVLLFRLALIELQKVWAYNQKGGELEVGIDGQISNWAIEDFDPRHPVLNENANLLYIDTSTPIVRRHGVEQLDPELFLRSAPPYLVWILRVLFLHDVMTRYYDARKVAMDLIANFYKEQRSELVPVLVQTANDYFRQPAMGPGIEDITEKEIYGYYKRDKLIWKLYLEMRRFDRFLRRKLLGMDYPYILPGNIKR